MKDDRLVFEYYKNRKIERGPQKINSCTKSILSILIGSLDAPRKRDITIEDLLTMSAGFDWPEFGEWNFFAPMVFSPNIVKFVFDRELRHDPGEKMNYNSGCSQVLTAILQKATGMKAVDFANLHLFQPLGIMNARWYEDTLKPLKLFEEFVIRFAYEKQREGV
ncbi:serine hydrolase domain-containing protein [Saccharibacillus alkalitolerans]|uniref:Serine hydrolase n=1 Tax=Saccharibacillus alkalitolerans TaxID=2705290 RepID=A0ABX0F793_9BACL|nr:serine hydrolase domain-containing protein [Saccharibacillus alkalitolerans]NGZ76682.1 serine hydrolase [Saccharibacillus alkalitolerans]